MGKGSTRRPEDTDAVRRNWPFPPKRGQTIAQAVENLCDCPMCTGIMPRRESDEIPEFPNCPQVAGPPSPRSTDMSFSQSASGTKDEVRSAIALLAEKVEASDRAANQHAAVIALHQAQAGLGVNAAHRFLDLVPDGKTVNVTVGGHGGVDEAGETVADSVWLSLGASLPAPTPATT